MPENLITEAQRYFLKAILVLAEKTFVEIKNFAHLQTESYRLYSIENSIPEEHRSKLVAEADEAIKHIKKLADTLDLESKTYDIRKIMLTSLLSIQDDFWDMQPKKLKGYGEVSPELAKIIEPWLEEINILVKSMLKSLKNPT